MWAADGTSKVLQGHEGPVQCVLVLPDGGLLSGGNDNTIRLWVDGKCQHTFSGHTDTVRWDVPRLLAAAAAWHSLLKSALLYQWQYLCLIFECAESEFCLDSI